MDLTLKSYENGQNFHSFSQNKVKTIIFFSHKQHNYTNKKTLVQLCSLEIKRLNFLLLSLSINRFHQGRYENKNRRVIDYD